jgi:hypothetical protein
MEVLGSACPEDDSHATGTKAARDSNFGSRLSKTLRS